jgi:hypothetical protein
MENTTVTNPLRQSKQALAEGAITRYLQEQGFTVMKTTVALAGITKVNPDAPTDFEHELIVKFFGGREA